MVYPGVIALQAQTRILNSFRVDAQPAEPVLRLTSSTVTDLAAASSGLWLGTGRGLSRTADNGLSFQSFSREQGIGQGGVSALAVSDEIIWVATGFDSSTALGPQQTGGGLAYSTDSGQSWEWVPQPGEIPILNITFDIALRGEEVWITSFAGGLRKSTDLGVTWQIIPPDTLIFDPPTNRNHRAFSVINADGTLWVGTAGGINRSVDGGETWTNFNHQNQPEPISGNFVIAIAQQKYQDREIIWSAGRTTTIESGDSTEFQSVFYTEDQGFSWKTTLEGETIWNIASNQDLVYVASDNGLWISNDFGATWLLFPAIENATGTQRVLSDNVFSVAPLSDGRLWVGSGDGVASTVNRGQTWEVFQAFSPAGVEGESRTYAYPNPFSPNVHNRLGGDGHVRFQYNTITATTATLKIYDFAMEHVVTVSEGVARPANGDFYETWNGRDADGRDVANGVYFYRLDLDGDGSFWGKLIVLK